MKKKMTIEYSGKCGAKHDRVWGRCIVNDDLITADARTLLSLKAKMRDLIFYFHGLSVYDFIIEEDKPAESL